MHMAFFLLGLAFFALRIADEIKESEKLSSAKGACFIIAVLIAITATGTALVTAVGAF